MRGKALRVLCFFLSAIMLFGLLIGCAGSKETETKKTVATEGSIKEAELYKERIKIHYHTGWTGQFDCTREKSKDHPGTANDAIFQFLEEKFNMEIYFHENMTADTLILEVASGDAGDIYTIPSWSPTHLDLFNRMKKDDLLLDIGGIVFKNPGRYPVLNMILGHPVVKVLNEFMSGDAEAFNSVPSLDVTKGGRTGSPVYNMVPFKGTDQKVPETLDEFIEILRAYKAKGMVPYSFDIRNGTEFGGIDNVFFTAYGSNMQGYYQDEQGNWYDAAISEKNKAIWKLVGNLYKEGLIKRDIITQDTYGHMAEWVDGNIGCIEFHCPNAHPGQYTWGVNQFLEKNKDATYEDIPMSKRPLRGPEGQLAKVVGNTVTVGNVRTVVSADTKDPERMLDFLEFILSDKGQDLIWWGVENVHYNVDASGNKKLIGEEYQKLMWHIYESEKDRTSWNYLWAITNANMLYVQYQRDGGWFEGAAKSVDLNYRLRPVEGAVKYAWDIIETFIQEGFESRPEFYNFVNFIDDTDKLIQTKLTDIKNRYFLSFLIAEKDPDKEWDNFVKEYTDAGGLALLNKHIKLYDEVKAKYDAAKK